MDRDSSRSSAIALEGSGLTRRLQQHHVRTRANREYDFEARPRGARTGKTMGASEIALSALIVDSVFEDQ
jgi:hypothetical protein